MPNQWKCNVCGYVHTGPEPPAVCPVCGAERVRFIPMETEKLNLLRDLYDTFQMHPVAAHFPNGLVPTAALCLLLALLTGSACIEQAVFLLLAVVLAAVPVSLASGIYDWRSRFGGEKAMIFYKKIALALLLFSLALAVLGLHHARPDILHEAGGGRWLCVGLILAMLPVAVLLGHYGAKLAFQWKKKQW